MVMNKRAQRKEHDKESRQYKKNETRMKGKKDKVMRKK
jgi:hypothetical protein